MHNALLPRISLLFCSIAFGALAACSGDGDDDAGASADEVQLEQAPIPTSLKELRAGLPYIPGIDEVPLGGGATCLPGAKVQVRGGNVTSTAAIVHTRSNLYLELGLDGSLTTPIKGLTGAASIAAKTTFDSRSASVLFQTAGTYETSLTTDTNPASFDPATVAKCGLGYVSRAQHRVAAALVVSMHSNSTNVDVRSSASVKPTVAEIKASLASVIQNGNVEVSLHFATDVVPNLPPAPFAESTALVVGDSDADKATALQKIETALGWLAQANNVINTYLAALQTSTDGTGGPAAPAVSVNFRYYPGTPTDLRTAIEASAPNATSTRKAIADVDGIITAWETFKKASASGAGFEWNVAGDPADNVDALNAKAADLLDTAGGKLRVYESDLSNQLGACSQVLRNDPPAADKPSMIAALQSSCKAPTAPPLDRSKLVIQPITTSSVSETTGGNSCDSGYRLPLKKELKIFTAWSKDRAAKSEGLWVQDNSGCTLQGSSWMFDGQIACSGLLSKQGLAVCVPNSGPLPTDGP
jgi:hypothetical protein